MSASAEIGPLERRALRNRHSVHPRCAPKATPLPELDEKAPICKNRSENSSHRSGAEATMGTQFTSPGRPVRNQTSRGLRCGLWQTDAPGHGDRHLWEDSFSPMTPDARFSPGAIQIRGNSFMRTNTTKAKLNEGRVVFGAIITRYAPDMVEIFGALGYDFVMIDCEHGPADLDQVEHMVRAAESFEITPIARIPDHSEHTILRFLDRGLQGIIVPHVNTGEQAAAIARAARYYPDGYRGMGGGRAQDYGIGVSRDEATSWINSQVLVIPMVEDIEAVRNLDDILQVSGADVLHVAASDLGQSLGNPGAAEVRRGDERCHPTDSGWRQVCRGGRQQSRRHRRSR